jgi:acetoin:2,6-dichlorophenolindophenol oxidoreductase subunit beta
MESRNLASTIKEITRNHLENHNGLLLGQSISAVGWVNNTVPDCKGIVELPMTDVAGSGIAVGAAIVGRRPIFVIRFQDFLILNGSQLIFYAAKVKELHNQTAPIFIRAIGTEGIGPCHSGNLHNIFMHFPGFNVFAPITPKEYEETWDYFMQNDKPMMCSEHRDTFQNSEEMDDILVQDAHITICAISATRLETKKAIEKLSQQNIKCNFVNIFKLKPFTLPENVIETLKSSKHILVVDSSYEIAGAAQAIAYEIGKEINQFVHILGVKDFTKCLVEPYQNRYPNSEQIVEEVHKIIKD